MSYVQKWRKSMAILTFKSNNIIVRVREEDFGCIVFSGDFYAEGNKSVFQIFSMVQQGLKKTEIVRCLAKEYSLPEYFIAEDLEKFLNTLAPFGLLQDFE